MKNAKKTAPLVTSSGVGSISSRVQSGPSILIRLTQLGLWSGEFDERPQKKSTGGKISGR